MGNEEAYPPLLHQFCNCSLSKLDFSLLYIFQYKTHNLAKNLARLLRLSFTLGMAFSEQIWSSSRSMTSSVTFLLVIFALFSSPVSGDSQAVQMLYETPGIRLWCPSLPLFSVNALVGLCFRISNLRVLLSEALLDAHAAPAPSTPTWRRVGFELKSISWTWFGFCSNDWAHAPV